MGEWEQEEKGHRRGMRRERREQEEKGHRRGMRRERREQEGWGHKGRAQKWEEGDQRENDRRDHGRG